LISLTQELQSKVAQLAGYVKDCHDMRCRLEEDKSSETLQEVQVQFAKTSNDMQLLYNQIQQIQFALGILVIG
jgi:hypothetical protein